AVERTQELVTDLVALMHKGDVPEARIFIDSPLATKASKVFVRHAHELDLGDELLRAFQSKHLRFTESASDSKSINRLDGFFIVISASGMCDAGRIRHHLEHRLWRADTTVLMAGYQAQGTLGRVLLEGKKRVRIQGDEVAVKATIRSLDDYSGHADGPELVAWLEERRPVRQNIFLVHGEGPSRLALRDRIADRVIAHDRVLMPMIDDTFDLGREGALSVEPATRRRLQPDAAARLDWNNELTELVMDINEAVRGTAGAKARRRIIRRLRRALTGE
ncbi:MAG: MBL fold metallo-hydrolase RNA specificity domain-containing protein, partial [Alphaproteobacteria bacterium]